MQIPQLHLSWDWNSDRSVGINQIRFKTQAGTGDKAFEPSQNNESVWGLKMPPPDWNSRVKIIHPPLSQEKVTCRFLPEIGRRGSFLKSITTCIQGLTRLPAFSTKINRSSKLAILKHLAEAKSKSISRDTSYIQTSQNPHKGAS